MKRQLTFLLVVLFCLMMTIGGALAQDDTVPRYEPVDDCFIEMPEGVDYDCGYVTVPEFHSEQTGNTISLGVVRLLTSADEPAEPIFVGAGGPGGTVIPWAKLNAEAVAADSTFPIAQMLDSRDVVYFAQRGTEFSEPHLNCPEVETLQSDDALFGVRTYAELKDEYTELLLQCHARYIEEGINFAAYNSIESAADIDTIREVLDYDQIVYYGESYGTLLGQHLMRDFPDILTAVILDGNVPISSPSWLDVFDLTYQNALDQLVQQCAADPTCNTAFPEFEEDLQTFFQQLQEEPFVLPLEVDGETLEVTLSELQIADSIFNSLYASFSRGVIPLGVDAALNGELSIMSLGSLVNVKFSGGMMHYAVVCAEDPPIEEEIDPSVTYSIIPVYAEYQIREYIAVCEAMNVPLLPAETDDIVATDLPVLMLSGTLDPVTPSFISDEVLAALPNSYSIEFPYGAHVQTNISNACTWGIIAQFIDDPTTAPDASCVADLEPTLFAVPDSE